MSKPVPDFWYRAVHALHPKLRKDLRVLSKKELKHAQLDDIAFELAATGVVDAFSFRTNTLAALPQVFDPRVVDAREMMIWLTWRDVGLAVWVVSQVTRLIDRHIPSRWPYPLDRRAAVESWIRAEIDLDGLERVNKEHDFCEKERPGESVIARWYTEDQIDATFAIGNLTHSLQIDSRGEYMGHFSLFDVLSRSKQIVEREGSSEDLLFETMKQALPTYPVQPYGRPVRLSKRK